MLDTSIPTRKRDRLLQAVPYALEERLAADVETLHFALGRSSPEGTDASHVSVAVVARSRMAEWISTLEKAGIVPHTLVPDVLALPRVQGHWTLLREPTTVLLRSGVQAGLALNPEWLPIALGEIEDPPLGLRVASVASLEPLPPIALPMEELACPNGVLALLVEGYHPDEAIHLLQGTYNRHEAMEQVWRPWRVAGILLVSLILLQFFLLVLEKRHLAAEDLDLRSRMTEMYVHAFPDARRVVNPRAQMEQRLNALHTQPEGDSDNLLGWLVRAAPVLGTAEGLELRALRYKEDGMELDLSIKNLQLLDQLKQHLAETHLDAEIRSARAQGDRVEAVLQIRNIKK